MSISLIVAISKNNCIGKNNALLWHIPEDMKHFKKLTVGKVVLMGRKTWESLPNKYRPLPNRTNVVITRQENYVVPENVEVYSNIDKAFEAHSDEEVAVIGGGQIYSLVMDKVDTLYITHVHDEVEGDTFFPEIDMEKWKETEREDHENFSFVTYKKI